MIDRYIKQLKNPKLHKDVTLVLISTPKVPIDTYLTNLHQIIIGDKTAKRLGNNFSSFRIWEALLSKDSTLTSFNLGLNEDKINFIKEQIEKIKKLSSKEDQKNALLTTVEFKETGAKFSRKKSARDWLNFYLNQIIVKETNRDEIDTTKLTKLANHIKSAGIKEIHYSHKFKDIDKAGPVSEME